MNEKNEKRTSPFRFQAKETCQLELNDKGPYQGGTWKRKQIPEKITKKIKRDNPMGEPTLESLWKMGTSSSGLMS